MYRGCGSRLLMYNQYNGSTSHCWKLQIGHPGVAIWAECKNWLICKCCGHNNHVKIQQAALAGRNMQKLELGLQPTFSYEGSSLHLTLHKAGYMLVVASGFR